MTQFLLLNETQLSSGIKLRPGRVLNDVIDDVAAITAAGGQVASLPNASLSALAAQSLEQQGKGQGGQDLLALFAGFSPVGTGVSPTRQILSGAGLSGGGDLSADRTLSADFSQVQTSLAGLVADQSVNGQKILNLGAPAAASDAATKGYVDAVAIGLDAKANVRALATSNITLSGAQTIDGVSVVAGNRVLVVGQTTASQNGIYVAAAGAWSRSSDMASGSSAEGVYCFISEGTVNGDAGWICTTNAPNDVVGTNSLAFAQFSSFALATSAPQDVSVSAASIGTSGRAAREDHKHSLNTDFGSNNITTTGSILVGSGSRSTIGTIRGPQTWSLNFRDAGDTADYYGLLFKSNQVFIGSPDTFSGGVVGVMIFPTSGGSVGIGTGNTTRLYVTSAGVGVFFNNNLGVFGGGVSFPDPGGGAGVIAIGNKVTAPTAAPVGGAVAWADGGAIKAEGSGGTITTMAPA